MRPVSVEWGVKSTFKSKNRSANPAEPAYPGSVTLFTERQMYSPHVVGEPSILYVGTPVVLISFLNDDGMPNLAPMLAAWWLGWRCTLGLGNASKMPQNLLRTGECVLKLPAIDQAGAVDRLARLAGTRDVPAGKTARGYRHEPHKFEAAGLTPLDGQVHESRFTEIAESLYRMPDADRARRDLE